MQTSSVTHEVALDVAAAFLKFFFDIEKRSNDNYQALDVYAEDSVFKVVQPNADPIVLEGADAIKAHQKAAPPSILTLDHFQAVPSHQDSVLISCSGTETIDITTYNYHRALILVKSESSYYLKSDLLNYFLSTNADSTARQNRRQKQPRTQPADKIKTPPAVAAPTPVPAPSKTEEPAVVPVTVVDEAPIAAEVTPIAPEPAPVVKAEETPAQVTSATIVTPAPSETTTEPAVATPVIVESTAPIRKPSSWASAVTGKDTPPPTTTATNTTAAVQAKNTTKKPHQPRKNLSRGDATPTSSTGVDNKTSMCFIRRLPPNTTPQSLIAALGEFGKVTHTNVNNDNHTAQVTFEGDAAQAAIAKGQAIIDNSTIMIQAYKKPFFNKQRPNNNNKVKSATPKTITA